MDIEQKIWDYIDGLCSLKEQEEIALLIKNNPTYKNKYEELMALQLDLQALDLDEPSMAFTNKVMDKITLINKPLSAKALIDKRIIYGLGSIFGILILACLVIVLSQVNWNIPLNTPSSFKVDLSVIGDDFNISSSTKTFLMYSFFMFDTILGLMILDKYFRKKLA
ncbi:MAG: hypothetical protein ABIP95_16050 [Pelobium sp.]